MVVNETFARRQFAAQNPIGQHVLIEQIITGKRELGPEVAWQIVGVVADEKVNSLDNTSAGVYVSYAQSPIVGVSLLVKGAAIRERADRHRPAGDLGGSTRTRRFRHPTLLEQIKSDSLGQTRLRTLLLAAFAVLPCCWRRWESTASSPT